MKTSLSKSMFTPFSRSTVLVQEIKAESSSSFNNRLFYRRCLNRNRSNNSHLNSSTLLSGKRISRKNFIINCNTNKSVNGILKTDRTAIQQIANQITFYKKIMIPKTVSADNTDTPTDIIPNFVDGDSLNNSSLTKDSRSKEITLSKNTLISKNKGLNSFSILSTTSHVSALTLDSKLNASSMNHQVNAGFDSNLNTLSSTNEALTPLNSTDASSRQLSSAQVSAHSSTLITSSSDFVDNNQGFMDSLMASIYNRKLTSIDFLSVSFFISGMMLMIFLIHMV